MFCEHIIIEGNVNLCWAKLLIMYFHALLLWTLFITLSVETLNIVDKSCNYSYFSVYTQNHTELWHVIELTTYAIYIIWLGVQIDALRCMHRKTWSHAKHSLTSVSGPLSAPGHEKVTNSWHRLWTTKQQTERKEERAESFTGTTYGTILWAVLSYKFMKAIQP